MAIFNARRLEVEVMKLAYKSKLSIDIIGTTKRRGLD